MTEEELIAIRVAVKNTQRANAELAKVARSIDDVGDEAATTDRKVSRAARSIARLSFASANTRLHMGPLSVRMKYAGFAIGGMILTAEKAAPVLLSAAEAAATLAGGAGAAGGVGLLALRQASMAAALGVGTLTDALAGNEEAARSLSPEAFELYRQLTDARDALRETSEAAMLPGLVRGGTAAMRNFEVIRGLARDTNAELGRLAGDAGVMLGSGEWGRDIQTLGRSNITIIGDLGDSALYLAGAVKNVAVEAAPLAEWIAENAREGARLALVWSQDARAAGELSQFFKDARVDMQLTASALDHVVDGIGNLFGNQDVDSSGLLEDLDSVAARFEEWTRSEPVQEDLSGAIGDAIALGVAAGLSTAAGNMPAAGARAAELFWDSFQNANPAGKALITAMVGMKAWGAVRGSTPLTPLYVKEVAGWGPQPPTPSRPRGLPGWLRGVGGAASAAARFGVRGGGAAGLAGGMIAALALSHNENNPAGAGAGAYRHGDDQRMRPSRDNRAAFERVPDHVAGRGNPKPLDPPGAFEPIVHTHVTVKVGEDAVAIANAKARAKRDGYRR